MAILKPAAKKSGFEQTHIFSCRYAPNFAKYTIYEAKKRNFDIAWPNGHLMNGPNWYLFTPVGCASIAIAWKISQAATDQGTKEIA